MSHFQSLMSSGQLITMHSNLFRHIRVVCLTHFQKGRLQTQCVAHQMVIVGQNENQFLIDITNAGQIGCSLGGHLIIALRPW